MKPHQGGPRQSLPPLVLFLALTVETLSYQSLSAFPRQGFLPLNGSFV
ncbi:MAG: hypothetical protein RLZZ158_2352 [Cyanobacteriota bacterium]|jgi:hypothetical protein